MLTKLILVEGIPGSGKSSTAHRVAEYLESHGVPCELFAEGNVHHPADFESVAYLTASQLDHIMRENPSYGENLREALVKRRNDFLLPYGKVSNEVGLPVELVQTLRKFDVYELPSSLFCEVMLENWAQFAHRQASREVVTVFECCFLQNNVTQLFVRNDEKIEYINNYMISLAEQIRELNPLMIYLNPESTSSTIDRARQERPGAWLDYVIWYHTMQGYGKRFGLHGLEGYVDVLEARQEIELSLLPRLPMNILQIDAPEQDWSQTVMKIESYLLTNM